MKKIMTIVLMTVMLLIGATTTQATMIDYAGSWAVDDGPGWGSNPLAYSGTGAAELLFGEGTYYISTVDNLVENINHMAHYAIIGIGYGDFAEDYFRGIEGVTHYQDVYVGDPEIDTVSAYVRDFANGGTNYAFRVVNQVPEPASLFFLIFGLVGLGFVRKKKVS